jgi:hypothetical protein
VEADNLRPLLETEGILGQQDVGMAPNEALAGRVFPGKPENVRKLDHFRTGREKGGLQAEGPHAFQQILLSQPEPLVGARIDPLECDLPGHD